MPAKNAGLIGVMFNRTPQPHTRNLILRKRFSAVSKDGLLARSVPPILRDAALRLLRMRFWVG
ncbi:hypothetical protein Q669_19160 [Labrenzia sp. C1B10]|nr:hypothetical protein Q669_19160 [Labrenzia sp. C1B10]ERP99931.1 hypothetical protein Q675_10235 [Labrenzia sp. C1B70]